MHTSDPKKEDQSEEDLGFPSLEFPASEDSTQQAPSTAPASKREPPTLAQCLETVRRIHPHIGRALDSLWGFAECETYLQRLIQDGSDGQDHARRGFSDEVMQALLTIAERHRVDKR